MAFVRAHEDDRVVAGRGGGDRCQMRVEGEHRGTLHRVFAAQWRIHVQPAEILADRL